MNITTKRQLKILLFIANSSLLLFFCFFNISSVEASEPNLVKELLFTVENSGGDAIGVKIMENPQRLPPLLWYNQNVSNPASPSYFAIDNYYALRDGRTVYVGAPNVNVSNYKISSYIYIFSYNEGASSETVDIFNQLLNNLKFNFNINNLTEKKEIQRDLLRIYDIDEIKNSLADYYNLVRNYPRLGSGTYIPGETYTKWPSWQYTLSNELGQSLPVDPINRFNGSCSDCPDNPNQPDYQCNGTCYNPTIGDFTHPNGSHVYKYYTPQNDLCAGQAYSLSANLEYQQPTDTNPVVWGGEENITIKKDDSSSPYNYELLQGMGECGNGILDPCEECECVGTKYPCDEGNFIPEKTCSGLGLGEGTLECDSSTCLWNRDSCIKRELGYNECDYDSECLSGYCSHGVCCNTACEGLCQDCAGGTCKLVDYGNDPRNVCSSDSASCLTGFCDGYGACELKIPGTSCGTCQYCSVDGECLNTPSGEDYNNECTDDPTFCQAGYCDGYGECAYYPEGFICGDCKKCGIYGIDYPLCNAVPASTAWYGNTICNSSGSIQCYDGWGNCDGSWTDGCETNLLSTFEHCGNCDNSCHDNQSCVMGICNCNAGWGDCTEDDGCETDLTTTNEHCGACDNPCNASEVCEEGSCVLSTFCLGKDAGTSCGNNMICDDSENCVCQENWGDCTAVDGCETDLTTTSNCGNCDTTCQEDDECIDGICQISCGCAALNSQVCYGGGDFNSFNYCSPSNVCESASGCACNNIEVCEWVVEYEYQGGCNVGGGMYIMSPGDVCACPNNNCGICDGQTGYAIVSTYCICE